MGKRNNQSSIRYSDEVKKYLSTFKGETFGDKFEGIVLKYFREEKDIDKKIKEKKEQVERLIKEQKKITEEIYKMRNMKVTMEEICNKAEKLKKEMDETIVLHVMKKGIEEVRKDKKKM